MSELDHEHIAMAELAVGDRLPLRHGTQTVRDVHREGDIITVDFVHDARGIRGPADGQVKIVRRSTS